MFLCLAFSWANHGVFRDAMVLPLIAIPPQLGHPERSAQPKNLPPSHYRTTARTFSATNQAAAVAPSTE
jgi:hypothetical protein